MKRGVFAFLMVSAVISVFPGLLCAEQIVYLRNDYISVGVQDLSGRIFAKTVGGDPDSTRDDNQTILYRSNPPTSLTVFRIDDLVTVYGSADGWYSIRPTNYAGKILTEWNIRGLAIRQYVEIVDGPTTGRPDTVHVYYVVDNSSGQVRNVGAEIILDVYAGDHDGTYYSLPDGTVIDREREFDRASMPRYWYSMESGGNVRVEGALIYPLLIRPDRVLFTEWKRLYDHLWDIRADNHRFPSLRHFDDAVGVFFDPRPVADGQKTFFNTLYGIYGAKVFSSEQLIADVAVPAVAYETPFFVTLNIENTSGKTVRNLKVALNLPRELTVASGSPNPLSVSAGDLPDGKKLTYTYLVDVTPYGRTLPESGTSVRFSLSGTISGEVTSLETVTPVTINPSVVITNVTEIAEPEIQIDTNVLAAVPETNAPCAAMTNMPPAVPVEHWIELSRGVWSTIDHYDYNRTNITENISSRLDRFASVLTNFPKVAKFRITGYTDDRGTERDNADLGLWRAEEVRNYLTGRWGFPPDRFEIVSGGQDHPAADNSTPEGRAKNRRVTIELIPESLTVMPGCGQ